MKRNIIQLMAVGAAAGLFIGIQAAQAADNDQQNQQSQQAQDPQNQTGQSGSTQTGVSGDQSQTQTGSQIGEAAGASQTASDPQAFIKEAYQENQTEIQLGQLAQQKGESSQVKEFGQHLVQGHQALNDKLKQLGDQKSVQLAAQLDAKHQRVVDEYSNLSGAEFDKRFMSQQVKAHKKAISLYQQAADRNSDSQVKEFAQDNLPALRQHLQMAQQHSTSIGEPAGAQQQQGQEQKDQQQQQPQQQPEPKQP